MKEQFTRKMYFKKYSRRVLVKCRETYSRKKDLPTSETVEWILNQKFPGEFRGKYNDAYFSTPRVISYSIYFNDEQIFDYIKERFGDLVLLYEKPLNQEHIDVLVKGRDKVITREKYFYDEFKMVARIHPEMESSKRRHQRSHFDEIKTWCKNSLEDENWRASGCWNLNVYFKDLNDAMLFKLTFSDYIKGTETIKLISELTCEAESAQSL